LECESRESRVERGKCIALYVGICMVLDVGNDVAWRTRQRHIETSNTYTWF
jgi:hypothetical protein